MDMVTRESACVRDRSLEKGLQG